MPVTASSRRIRSGTFSSCRWSRARGLPVGVQQHVEAVESQKRPREIDPTVGGAVREAHG
nr:hypothetical protein [Streptomyces sp. TLI_235]